MATTKLKPRTENEEIWEVQVSGTIYLQVTTHNRYGQPMQSDLALGPNRVGHQFRITTEDRIWNQERVQDAQHDPFTNGMLVRCDADQSQDEDTASEHAVSAADLQQVFELHGKAFENAVQKFNEVVLRRLYDLGDALDATHKQQDYLAELIKERYGKGGPQDLDKAQPLSV